jgi:GNAT superfamily N-acetyltransferase
MHTDLARSVDAAQSIRETPLADQARVLEHALARSAAACARAMAKLDPSSRASAVEIAGGIAIFAGQGSPLTQALAVGLDGPVTPADLDAIERHVSPDGRGPKQLEVCPFVDPSLTELLADRGYRVNEWQLTWTRDLGEPVTPSTRPVDAEVHVARVKPGEEDTLARAILAAFLESDEVPEEAIALMRPAVYAEGYEPYLARVGDEPAGGATVAHEGDVAIVSGAGVRQRFRRRGIQSLLLHLRLARAKELGARVAYSNTLPGTASRRNMERAGFHVAYPKIVMLKD